MKAHESVLAWVVEELRAGRLHVGDHLPSERALAEHLGVSRGSLREALRVLEALGAITSATGSGPRAGTVITANTDQAIAMALGLQLATGNVTPANVYEIRLMLETAAVQQSSPDAIDWASIDKLLVSMDAEGIEPAEFLQLDAALHVALSQGAGNPLVSSLMLAFRSSIADHTAARAAQLDDWEATAARLRSEHHEITRTLRNGDAAGASALLADHIRRYYDETNVVGA